MINRAVFMDRDGTINRDMCYLSDIRKLYIFSRAPDAIRLLRDAGFKIIIVTNQSGVGRGFIKKNDVRNINRKLKELLAQKNVKIDAIYVCPHHPDEHCICRKPEIGLLKKAEKDFNLNLSESYFIGDKLSDVEIADKAGLKGAILVLTGLGRRQYQQARKNGVKVKAVCRDLFSAAKKCLTDAQSKN